MRVHANRDSALVLAAQASKAVPKITTIPELKGIHMEADARLAMLTMTATNQEVSIRASMPAAVEESGSAVIPADLLPDILKRLPGDQVSFSTVGPGIIHIGSGYAEYRLNILDAAKYRFRRSPFWKTPSRSAGYAPWPARPCSRPRPATNKIFLRLCV